MDSVTSSNVALLSCCCCLQVLADLLYLLCLCCCSVVLLLPCGVLVLPVLPVGCVIDCFEVDSSPTSASTATP